MPPIEVATSLDRLTSCALASLFATPMPLTNIPEHPLLEMRAWYRCNACHDVHTLDSQVCNLQPRLYHSATAFSHYPGETEVVLFGGMSHKNDVAMANTTMLRFGKSCLYYS